MALFVYQIQGCFSWQSQDVTTWYDPLARRAHIYPLQFLIVPWLEGLARLNLIQGNAFESWQSREWRGKNKDWDEAVQLNCQGTDLTPLRNLEANLLRMFSVWTNWMLFLYLQRERRKEWAERDSKNKQYFKYQMTHLMGDILSSHIQSVCHMFCFSFEDNGGAVETASWCYSVITSIILALSQHIWFLLTCKWCIAPKSSLKFDPWQICSGAWNPQEAISRFNLAICPSVQKWVFV